MWKISYHMTMTSMHEPYWQAVGNLYYIWWEANIRMYIYMLLLTNYSFTQLPEIVTFENSFTSEYKFDGINKVIID